MCFQNVKYLPTCSDKKEENILMNNIFNNMVLMKKRSESTILEKKRLVNSLLRKHLDIKGMWGSKFLFTFKVHQRKDTHPAHCSHPLNILFSKKQNLVSFPLNNWEVTMHTFNKRIDIKLICNIYKHSIWCPGWHNNFLPSFLFFPPLSLSPFLSLSHVSQFFPHNQHFRNFRMMCNIISFPS